MFVALFVNVSCLMYTIITMIFNYYQCKFYPQALFLFVFCRVNHKFYLNIQPNVTSIQKQILDIYQSS
jgi:hypothetical protein